MLVGLLPGHINLHYYVVQDEQNKVSLCRTCGAEKEMSVNCLELQNINEHMEYY